MRVRSLTRRLCAQALAALRAQQGFPEEALATLRQSIARWLPPVPDGDADEAAMDATCLAEPPGFEFRFETAKLLLDLDETTDVAVRILEVRMKGRLLHCQALPELIHLSCRICWRSVTIQRSSGSSLAWRTTARALSPVRGSALTRQKRCVWAALWMSDPCHMTYSPWRSC